MAQIGRTGWIQRRKNGAQTLTLLKVQGDNQPFRRVATVSRGFFLGTVKDLGTGAKVDALLVDEGPDLSESQIRQADAIDLVGTAAGASALRYTVQGRIPPVRKQRRWMLSLRANFGDLTAVEV